MRDYYLAASVCQNDIKFASTVETKINIAKRVLSHTFYIWSSSPFDVIIRTDLMKKYGPTSIDYAAQRLWFADDPDNAIPVIVDPKTYKAIPVAMIKDTRITPRSSQYIQVKCQSHVPIPNTTIYFEGVNKVQDDKKVHIPSAVTTVECHQSTIMVSNWSQQPITLYANTVIGNVTQLYDNPSIAIILEMENNDHDDLSIGHVEAQFKDIATADTNTQHQTKPWYDTSPGVQPYWRLPKR